jgi:lipopolysaccharide assembly outer membrane protein LptD (OstA)
MNKHFMILILIAISFVSFGELINVKAGDFIGGEDYNILKKDVIIKKGNLLIETQMATITLVNDEWRKLVSTEMSITSDTYEASSNSTEFDLQTEKGTLTGEVIANIFLNNSELNIITDVLEIDNREKKYSGSSENITKIYKDDYVITTKKFEYNETDKTLYLKGSVSIINEKKKIELISDNATFNTETDEMKAEKVDLTLEIED